MKSSFREGAKIAHDGGGMRTLSRRSFVRAMGVAALGAMTCSVVACAPASDSGNAESGEETIEADLVIVGGGGAGLAAGVTAAEAGKKVIILEKLKTIGGTFGLSHLETIALDEGSGEYYDAESLFDYWMDQTEGKCNEELMRKVTGQINDTLDWIESMGCTMYTTGNTRPDAPAPIAFKSPSETGELASGAGGLAAQAMKDRFEELGGTIRLETVARSFVVDEAGAVCGVVAETKGKASRFMAPCTILTTGSFESGIGGEGNPVIAEYLPKLLGKNMYHVAAGYEGNTGDGIIMGRDVGANVEFHIPYVRGRMMCGGTDAQITGKSMLVNGDMERFGNEAGLFRDLYNDAVEKGGNEAMYALCGQGNLPADMARFENNEAFFEASSVSELASLMKVEVETLGEAIETYNSYASSGIDEAFQKPAEFLVAIEGAPVYAEKVSLLVGGCIGGLTVDGRCRVLSKDGEPIAGLFAAGDTCNLSFHGDFYLGSGSNTCFALNSGRIAARETLSEMA